MKKCNPESRNGGDRRSELDQTRRDQSEIFSFSSLAAERTGLSTRAIEISVSIAKRIGGDTRARIQGTWLADHQAGLIFLAQQAEKVQSAILDILFAPVDKRRADTVADALLIVEGRARPRPADQQWQVLTSKMARATRDQRLQLCTLYEDEVVAFVRARGLV